MRKLLRPCLYRNLIVVLLFGGLFSLVAEKIVRRVDYLNSDFFSFWLAGRMLLTGKSPYIEYYWVQGHNIFGATWISDTRFLYPLPLALFCVPLGLLSTYTAFIFWTLFLEVMIVSTVFALFFQFIKSDRIKFIIPFLAGVTLFRPTLVTLFYGQISGLFLLILTCVVLLWEKDKWLSGAFLLPFIALKPNLGIPILIIISFWLLIQKKIRILIVFAFSGLFLVLIGMIIDPHWVIEYLSVGNTKITQTFGFSPTLWGLSTFVTNYKYLPAIIVGGITISVFLIGVLYLVWRNQNEITPLWIISIAITSTLLITPYTWPYDQLLLILPIFAIILEMKKRKYPFLLTSIIFIVVDIIAFIILIISARIQLEIFNVFIPLIVFCALIICIIPMKKATRNVFIE